MNGEIPTSRVYIHARCGRPTEVSGPEFAALADPLAGMERTLCADCEEMDSLSQFAWEDTGEKISAYYARHLQSVSPADRQRARRSNLFRFLGIGGVLGLLVSAGLGTLVGVGAGIGYGVLAGTLCGLLLIPLGAIGGFKYFEKQVVAPILRRTFQVHDARQLR